MLNKVILSTNWFMIVWFISIYNDINLHIWGYWYFSQQSGFQLALLPAQHFSWCNLNISQISRVAISKLDVLFSYLEPVCCSMSSSNCCFLTCIQVSQEVGQVVWYSHLFKNFPQFVVIHTVKGLVLHGQTCLLCWVSLEVLLFDQIPYDENNFFF